MTSKRAERKKDWFTLSFIRQLTSTCSVCSVMSLVVLSHAVLHTQQYLYYRYNLTTMYISIHAHFSPSVFQVTHTCTK